MRPRTPLLRPEVRSQRGHALVEFAFVLPMLLILVFCTVDFGHLVQTRLIITNISREGGSIGSRQIALDNSLANLLVASGLPLVLDGPDGRVILSRIAAGQSDQAPDPIISTQITSGSLGVPGKVADGNPNLGLSQAMYDHLVFDSDQGAADIKEVTVVEGY